MGWWLGSTLKGTNMPREPYEVLGVAKNASGDEIKKAYRKLAKTNHPDLHPGDDVAKQRFKEISQAYGLLGDAEKRARYDSDEIDADGNERPRAPFHGQDASGPGGFHYSYDGDPGDLGDLFSNLFGGRGGFGGGPSFDGRAERSLRGQDIHCGLTIDFLDAVNGSKRRVTMGDGSHLDITLPKGLRDGQSIRLKGKGMAGMNGAPAGDALVTVKVRPHPTFRREGDDIHMTQSISLTDAVLGGKVHVPTVTEFVALTVPENSSSGRVLRLRGRGVRRDGKPAGDQLVTLQITLPRSPDPELVELLRRQREQAGKSEEALAA